MTAAEYRQLRVNTAVENMAFRALQRAHPALTRDHAIVGCAGCGAVLLGRRHQGEKRLHTPFGTDDGLPPLVFVTVGGRPWCRGCRAPDAPLPGVSEPGIRVVQMPREYR